MTSKRSGCCLACLVLATKIMTRTPFFHFSYFSRIPQAYPFCKAFLEIILQTSLVLGPSGSLACNMVWLSVN